MKIIDSAKEVADLIQKYNDVKLYRKMVELEAEIVELAREKNDLLSKLETLNKKQSIADEMEYEYPFWFREDDFQPHCPRCWEVDERPVHLDGPYTAEHQWTSYNCPACKYEKLYEPGKRFIRK